MMKQSWKLIGSERKQEVLTKQYGLFMCKRLEVWDLRDDWRTTCWEYTNKTSSFENLLRKWCLFSKEWSLILHTSKALLMTCSRMIWHFYLLSNVFSVTTFLQGNSGAFDVESAEGKAATVGYGRPNLKKLITEAVAGLDSSQSVEVIVSGRTIQSALHDLPDWPWLPCHKSCIHPNTAPSVSETASNTQRTSWIDQISNKVKETVADSSHYLSESLLDDMNQTGLHFGWAWMSEMLVQWHKPLITPNGHDPVDQTCCWLIAVHDGGGILSWYW